MANRVCVVIGTEPITKKEVTFAPIVIKAANIATRTRATVLKDALDRVICSHLFYLWLTLE
ncbi:hypothetical protein IQ10_03538 [Halalkalibacter nanhaiisediminis]|uniref:Uncharacterized protein n=1 Tax=Halalkalibacter nanhaiisediminis TaxID=688079 RepID=A0A562Q844_9BACI|nr:hypothetical protein IQ10_03538 [Halalkalibacter nanhaiisediminis]